MCCSTVSAPAPPAVHRVLVSPRPIHAQKGGEQNAWWTASRISHDLRPAPLSLIHNVWNAKEVISMFPVPIVVEAFIAGVAAGKQICDLFDD